jgi:hypothetical protein
VTTAMRMTVLSGGLDEHDDARANYGSDVQQLSEGWLVWRRGPSEYRRRPVAFNFRDTGRLVVGLGAGVELDRLPPVPYIRSRSRW